MACCGQRRVVPGGLPAAGASIGRLATRPLQYRVTPAPVLASSGVMAPLRYVKQSGITVRGPATGKHYTFTVAAPVQLVDAHDLTGLLRTSWFRRA